MVLGLDGTVGAGAALLDGDRVVGAATVASGARPAAQLIPLVTDALVEAGVTRTAVRALAVGVGPGSYAGVRAAVVTAKAWAWAADLPLAAVDSLRALALIGGPWTGPIWAVLDARNGNVYAACYRLGPDGLPQAEVNGRHMAGAELADLIAADARSALVAGAAGPWVGAARLADAAIAGMAGAVARLGAAQLAACGGVDPLELRPHYLRPPQVGRPALSPDGRERRLERS